MNILFAILIFGFLIFIHELGHYLFARKFGVDIEEFSIGMGPKIFSKVSKKTGILYSLRLLPIGGYVSMAGEDSESESENAFGNKPVWQRIIITAAGGVINIIVGIIVMCIFVACSPQLGSTVVADFDEDALSVQYGLEVNDQIIKVNGTRVYSSTELLYEIMHDGTKPIDLTVIRNGEKIVLNDVKFGTEDAEGVVIGAPDFMVYGLEKNFKNVAQQSFGYSGLAIRQVWESLFDLVTGRYGINELSGPVGTTEVIGEAAEQGFIYVMYLGALISVNLGVLNLLPIPALDGGRIVFLIIEAIRKKKLPNNIEAKIHYVGIILLMLLMLIVTCKDVANLFK
ncbi:MAG: site-2 protease family protein [Clostridia bacterium]|nr:site-2 protease family protein [Clostridia bacterium]MBQ5602355.1 site-2 protease family protein [Clostridia bacterium]